MNQTSSQIHISNFWSAPDDALFNQKVISAVTNFSESWLERQRWAGGGIKYIKCQRKCLYRKSDVIKWIDQHQTGSSTSKVGGKHD